MCKELVICESESFLNSSSACNLEDPDENVFYRFSFEPQTMDYQCKADLTCAFDLCKCQLDWAIKIYQKLVNGNVLEVESDFMNFGGECEIFNATTVQTFTTANSIITSSENFILQTTSQPETTVFTTSNYQKTCHVIARRVL